VAQRILHDIKHISLNTVSPVEQQFASTQTGAANRTHEPHRMRAAILSCILCSSFRWPTGNINIKIQNYNSAGCFAWMKQTAVWAEGIRQKLARLLIIFDRRRQQVTPEGTILYNAEPDCLYTAPHTICFSVVQQPPHC
jgi:hypothetical protein